MNNIDDFSDYSPALEVWAMAGALIKYFNRDGNDDLDELEECAIVYLFTGNEIKIGGRQKTAFVTLPQAQGQCKKIFVWTMEKLFGISPDVIMVVCHEWWKSATIDKQMALVYHELKHIVPACSEHGRPRVNKKTYKPVFELRDHDVEEFLDVVEVFGDWSGSVSSMKVSADREDTKLSQGGRKQIMSDYKGRMKCIAQSGGDPMKMIDEDHGQT